MTVPSHQNRDANINAYLILYKAVETMCMYICMYVYHKPLRTAMVFPNPSEYSITFIVRLMH
jgi:hypothetical protein